MKRLLCIVILFIPIAIIAQGIQFENGLSWQQIKQKAKAQNKFIFVDCYATWCLPCKKMEKEIFPLKDVGDYMNEHFISVRVQMDTSKADDAHIQGWYKDAAQLKDQYKVKAFPS